MLCRPDTVGRDGIGCVGTDAALSPLLSLCTRTHTVARVWLFSFCSVVFLSSAKRTCTEVDSVYVKNPDSDSSKLRQFKLCTFQDSACCSKRKGGVHYRSAAVIRVLESSRCQAESLTSSCLEPRAILGCMFVDF